jgi:hypothetical protein
MHCTAEDPPMPAHFEDTLGQLLGRI